MACYSDPNNARGVGRTAARYEASIFFATPDQLERCGRNPKLHPLMFASMRLVMSGGQKLGTSTRKDFEKRFRCEIFEGYTLAEASSFVSLNIPDILETAGFSIQRGNKEGTVGLPLPGTAIRIVDPETLEVLKHREEGLILIGGAQVMSAYLDDTERTDAVMVERDGLRWYKTGDMGWVDEDGFLTINGARIPFEGQGGQNPPKNRTKMITIFQKGRNIC
jgi:acyl-[acyl-carrier-protein]-phospholipid O-acyltransferase/long-chain-fatty-acid--[acyl-carrier-protein] ligase